MTLAVPGGSSGGSSDASSRRLFLLQAVVIALLLTLFGRLWFLQVDNGAALATLSQQNANKQVITTAPRGIILDDAGNKLVDNQSALVVTLSRTTLDGQKPSVRQSVLNRLGGLLTAVPNLSNVSPSDLAHLVEPCVTVGNKNVKVNPPPLCNPGSSYQPVAVATMALSGKHKVSMDVVRSVEGQIKEHPDQYPGVGVGVKAERTYPQEGAVPGTTLAAQTLGHLGPLATGDTDKTGPYASEAALLNTGQIVDGKPLLKQEDVGRGGLEQQYDAQLRGLDGVQTLSVTRNGDVNGTVSSSAPIQGDDLVLNIDKGIQKAAEQALLHGLQLAREYPSPGDNLAATQGAAAVVMTTDGRVVALASNPSFDETVYQDTAAYNQVLSDPQTPFNNRATAGQYPPGSSFKPITSSAILASGIASVGQGLGCPTTIPIGNSTLHNFEGGSLPGGPIQTLLEVSCDTYFAGVGADQWARDGGYRDTKAEQAKPANEYLAKMALAYGFGRSVGVDLPEGSPGLVVDRKVQKQIFAEQKKNYCYGAAHRPKGTKLQLYDEDACNSDGAYRQGDAAYFAIGQGSLLEVTPLQMARSYAAIANGGTLYAPTVGKALVRPDGRLEQTITPRKTGTVPVPQEDLTAIRQGMYEVTHGSLGTGFQTFGNYPVPVCGKTGTAEVQSVDKDGNGQVASDTSWFGSFAPCSGDGSTVKNGYVVMVVIPHGGQGAQVAAPIVKDIDDAIFQVTGNKVGRPNGPASSLLPCFKANGTVAAPSAGCTHAQAPSLSQLQQQQTVVTPASPATGAPTPLGSPAADVPDRRRSKP